MPLVDKAKAADTLLNIQDTPVFWVGMFKKILLNTKSLHTQLYKTLPKEIFEEISGMDAMAEIVTYSRSWYYISKINLDNNIDVDALKVFADENLILGINLSIKYFENKEEYEKCAHLKRIQDKVRTFIN